MPMHVIKIMFFYAKKHIYLTKTYTIYVYC